MAAAMVAVATADMPEEMVDLGSVQPLEEGPVSFLQVKEAKRSLSQEMSVGAEEGLKSVGSYDEESLGESQDLGESAGNVPAEKEGFALTRRRRRRRRRAAVTTPREFTVKVPRSPVTMNLPMHTDHTP